MMLIGLTGTQRLWGTFPTCPVRWKLTPLIALALAAALVAAPAIAAEGGHAGASTPVPTAHKGGGPEGGQINPLEFKGDLAIFTFVVFVLLLVILGKYAWGPITDALEKREHRIAEQIAAAEQANIEAKRILSEYQNKLAAAEADVREILERGRRDAEQIGRQMLDQTREESRREKERALREIEAATGEALKELAERSADLAVDLAGKIIEAKLDRGEHARLIEQAMAGFGAYSPLPPRERGRG